MVAHAEDAVGFIPPCIGGVVEVPRDDDFKSILFAGEQIFLTMADGMQGLVIHMATNKKVKCFLGPFHMAAKRALPLHCVKFRAVATTSNHFILHGKHRDGSYMVTSLRLPDASLYDDGHCLIPQATFAQLWDRDHQMSSLGSESSCPRECSVENHLALHGSTCTLPVCIVCADNANVEVLQPQQPPPGACVAILTSALNLQRSFFVTTLGFDDIETTRTSLHLAVWHVASSALINYVDLLTEPTISRCLSSELLPTQLEVHPRLPLVAIDFGMDSPNNTDMETVIIRFPLEATSDLLFPRVTP